MSEPDVSDGVLIVGAIRVSAARIEEMQDGRVLHAVERADVRSVQLRHGFLAKHPVIQIVFGAGMTLLSGSFVVFGIQMAMDGHVMIWPMLAGGFALLGLWVVYDAVRRGSYLEIWTEKGAMKMVIGAGVSSDALERLKVALGG